MKWNSDTTEHDGTVGDRMTGGHGMWYKQLHADTPW